MTAQAAEPVICRRCGVIPPDWRTRRPACLRCRVTERLERLLDDGTGRISPPLQPFATALLDTPSLEVARQYLYKPHAVDLLTALATRRLPLTHDALNGWPHHVAARHLRHKLIACGVLPPIDRQLSDIEIWLHHRLGQLTDHPHERLLRQFALWYQLPKLRATAKQHATQQFTQAQIFLTWLHDNTIAPANVTQATIDAWYASHRVHQRQRVRGFLTWAIDHGHLPRHLALPRVVFKPGTVITQQRRLALLRRYVTDDTVALPIRVAVCLLLLYAQPLSRIHRLAAADLVEADGELQIRLGDPPTPVPQPFADLLRQLATAVPQATRGGCSPANLPASPSPTPPCPCGCAGSVSRSSTPGWPRCGTWSCKPRHRLSPTRSASTRRAPPAKSPTPVAPGAATRTWTRDDQADGRAADRSTPH